MALISPGTLIPLPGGGEPMTAVDLARLPGSGYVATTTGYIQTSDQNQILLPSGAQVSAAIAHSAWAEGLLNSGEHATIDAATGQHSRIGGGGTGGSTPAPATPPKPRTRDFDAEARLLFPWIPDELRSVFTGAWEQYGDANLAMASLRADSRYDRFFPGNKREDGTVRMTESEYLSTIEGYNREMSFYGLNPGDFAEKRRSLIEGDVSVNEFAGRLGKLYTGIATRVEPIRDYYARAYGASNLSTTAIMASALDGSASPIEFERRIRVAQIGGNAQMFSFNIARQEAERLESFGLDDQAARTLYARASTELPTLNALIQRFDDPEDELTVDEYADALVINDPRELAVISRLFQRESATYSPNALFGTTRSGAQRGLLSR